MLPVFLYKAGVNFTNIFTLSFYARRSQKHKKTDDLTVFFTLLGPASIKAIHRTLMKLSPGPIISILLFQSHLFDVHSKSNV